MSDYDFHHIFEAYEFQDFARDMIQVREKKSFESFREGRDLGIDSRCIGPDGTCTVLQAKRWENTSVMHWKKLEQEREKVRKLNPDRYILVLTQDLTPVQKKKVKEFFAPYILEERDIIGSRDLNNWLDEPGGNYRKVEEKYFKLWIQNTRTLKRMLQEAVNSVLMEESRIELENAVENAKVFVETNVYYRALNQLNKNKVIIISGEPGMGKTTLANQLALYYLFRQGFDLFVWANSVDDLYKAQQQDGKKVVVFDDFWGSNFLDRMTAGREEERLARFIESIYKKKDYMLLLTTREYVLEQGLKQHENLRKMIEKHKLECRLEAYSAVERVKIYLGHLKRYRMTPDQLSVMFGLHKQVVDSPNYNPRVIGGFVKEIRPEMNPGDCGKYFLRYLEHPNDFWKKIFHDLSKEARALYIMLYLMPVPVEMGYVKECYTEILPCLGRTLELQEFAGVVAELEKTVIRTDLMQYSDVMTIKFQNPSARDFMFEYLKENFEQQKEMLLLSCRYFFQAVQLLELAGAANAPGEFYARAMKRGLSLLGSPSILSRGAEYGLSDEEYLYYDELQWNEVGYSRNYHLLMLYQGESCHELEAEFKYYYNFITTQMKEAPLKMEAEDIKEYPYMANRALCEGLAEEPETVIEAYMYGAQHNRMRLELEIMSDLFGEDWDRYRSENLENLRSYLEIYYRGEMCLAAVQEDIYRFADLEFEYVEDYRLLGIEPDERLKEYIEKYNKWLQDVETDEDEEEMYDEEDPGGYGQVTAEFEAEFIGKPYTPISGISEYMEGNFLTDQEKMWLECAQNDEKYWYWKRFLKSEELLQLFLKITVQREGLVGSFSEALSDLFSYFGGILGCEEAAAARFFYRLNQAFPGKDEAWGEEVLLSILEEEFASPESLLKRLTEGGIFIRRGHWYYLAGRILLLFSCFYMFRESGLAAQAKFYQYLYHDETESEEWGERQRQLAEAMKPWRFLYTYDEELKYGLWELGGAGFREYAIVPEVRRYCKKMEAEGEECIPLNLLIDVLTGFSVRESGEVVGSDMYVDTAWELLEMEDPDFCTDLLPESFGKEQMEILRTHGLLEFGEKDSVDIEVSDLMKDGLLEALGFLGRAKNVWDRLKDLCRGEDVAIEELE